MKCTRIIQWHGKVEKITVDRHVFAYSGSVPCTGPVRCIHCGIDMEDIMLRTTQDITINFRGHGEITIPKGTRCTHMTACGFDENVNFVDDLSWIPTYPNGMKRQGLIHDARYYGIMIPAELVEEQMRERYVLRDSVNAITKQKEN